MRGLWRLTLGLLLGSTPAWATVTTGNVRFLDQGWTQADRETYYNTSQGSIYLSYDIYQALEQATSEVLFRSDANIEAYGLTPQLGALPIGLAKTNITAGPWRGEWVGLSCAACHNAQLEFRGKKIRVDGGFNHTFDLNAFVAGLDLALAATTSDMGKFARITARLGLNDLAAQDDLRRRLEADRAYMHYISTTTYQPSSPVGPGRMDALDLVHNQVVSTYLGVPENWQVSNAPVKWPFLWNAPQSAWIGWRGTQQFPLQRNAGEAMGLSAHTNLTAATPDAGLFDSTVDIAGQIKMEDLLRRLAPPPWPEDVLGAIDQSKAAQGERLYVENCSSCHSVWPHRWSDVKRKGKRFIENALLPVEVVGTDPTQAQNIAYGLNPTFLTGALAPYLPPPYRNAAVAPALMILVPAVVAVTNKAVARLGLSAERLEDVSGFRNESEPTPPNGLYKSAPRDGTWAIAPYLHNGSVPNLYELLIPAALRSKTFYVGREFDAVKVGIDTSGKSGKFLFDTTLVGNANTGHSFEDGPRIRGVIGRLLSDSERWALIEYLKSIPSAPAQIAPFGGPKHPVEAWKDPTFYHVQHPGGYQEQLGGAE